MEYSRMDYSRNAFGVHSVDYHPGGVGRLNGRVLVWFGQGQEFQVERCSLPDSGFGGSGCGCQGLKSSGFRIAGLSSIAVQVYL